DLKGLTVEGYEIHNGRTTLCGDAPEFTGDSSGYCSGNVYGTYLHGFFDRKEILETVLKKLAEANNKQLHFNELTDYFAYKQSQYDLLAKGVRESLDMQYIYRIMGLEHEVG
ncbi:MAG: cobyric acid synthase CobQ, partial [Lachnospiraceae bacterium]|nr:cobyric acid synthase CobQ [Lachnospiraceae bacterium]